MRGVDVGGASVARWPIHQVTPTSNARSAMGPSRWAARRRLRSLVTCGFSATTSGSPVLVGRTFGLAVRRRAGGLEGRCSGDEDCYQFFQERTRPSPSPEGPRTERHRPCAQTPCLSAAPTVWTSPGAQRVGRHRFLGQIFCGAQRRILRGTARFTTSSILHRGVKPGPLAQPWRHELLLPPRLVLPPTHGSYVRCARRLGTLRFFRVR